jgi:hypothetical protein
MNGQYVELLENTLITETNRIYWRDWKLKEVVDLSIRPPEGMSNEEYMEVINSSPTISIPKSYFKKEMKTGIFEPYEKEDIRSMPPRVKKLLKQWEKGNPLAYVIAKGTPKKYDVEDGWTRSALAYMLDIPVKAKLVTF